MSIKGDAETIISESLQAVLPDAAVKKALESKAFSGSVYIVAIGKAAWRMAAAAARTLGNKLQKGIVITKYGHSEGDIPSVAIYEAGHPVPDENGAKATEKAMAMVEALGAADTVLFLVSGGGSALFESPSEGVSLSDIADLTRALLASGADIVEINTIRKHLSKVKGGWFAELCAPAKVYSVVLSDVLGDPLDSIASGPAYPDGSTSAEALAVLEKYGLSVPENVRDALEKETPKSLQNIESVITGNVTALCAAAAKTAAELGYTPLVLTTMLDCEAREAGAFLSAIAREIKLKGQPIKPPCAVILGGETVVQVKGGGKGGRNQELALAAAKGIAGLSDTLVFSVGSDGTDGPTDAAGGMVTGDFWADCARQGLSVDSYLKDNNAYEILSKMKGLIVTGPTGTNVNDLMVVLCG